jgi:hypothetical protein
MPRTARVSRPAKCLEPPEGCGTYATPDHPSAPHGPYSIRHVYGCLVDREYRATEQVRREIVGVALARYRTALARLVDRGLVTAGSPGVLKALETACTSGMEAELHDRGLLP